MIQIESLYTVLASVDKKSSIEFIIYKNFYILLIILCLQNINFSIQKLTQDFLSTSI